MKLPRGVYKGLVPCRYTTWEFCFYNMAAGASEIQNMATNIFVANGWLSSQDEVSEARDYRLFDKFTSRLSLSNGIKNLMESRFEDYLFLMARDYFAMGYAAVYQQTDSGFPYDEIADWALDGLLDEIWQVGAFEYAIGPMGTSAKSTTQDICLMTQTFVLKFCGLEEMHKEEFLTAYKKALYNIGIAMGNKIVGPHLK